MVDDPRAGRGESLLHKTLKKEACRWLFRVGYRCVAAEVRLRQLGIIDSVGTGLFGPYFNHLKDGRHRPQTCFVECKASRADFLRDLTHRGQLELALIERGGNHRRRKGRRTLRQRVGLGKFDACVMQPLANLHYVLAPAGLLKKEEIPHRWGLLVLGDGGVSVVKSATWQETTAQTYVESQIARTLTCDIYRADDRAMSSVNREIVFQQEQLAQKIRALKASLAEPIAAQMREVERMSEALVVKAESRAGGTETAAPVAPVSLVPASLVPVSLTPVSMDRPIRRLRRKG
jgi:hypothetical protein